MRRIARALVNAAVVASLLLCGFSLALLAVARQCDLIKANAGSRDRWCWYAQASADGQARFLWLGPWPHPPFAAFLVGPPDQYHAGEVDLKAWLDGPPKASDRTFGAAGFLLMIRRCTPCLYDGPSPTPKWRGPPVRPTYFGPPTVPFVCLMFPTWALPASFAILPGAIAARRWARRRSQRLRRERGLCRACSYDLTGNLTGVCPECGTAVLTSAE